MSLNWLVNLNSLVVNFITTLISFDAYQKKYIGTLCQNLDLFEQHNDTTLNDALRSTGLFSLQEEAGEEQLTLSDNQWCRWRHRYADDQEWAVSFFFVLILLNKGRYCTINTIDKIRHQLMVANRLHPTHFHNPICYLIMNIQCWIPGTQYNYGDVVKYQDLVRGSQHCQRSRQVGWV